MRRKERKEIYHTFVYGMAGGAGKRVNEEVERKYGVVKKERKDAVEAKGGRMESTERQLRKIVSDILAKKSNKTSTCRFSIQISNYFN